MQISQLMRLVLIGFCSIFHSEFVAAKLCPDSITPRDLKYVCSNYVQGGEQEEVCLKSGKGEHLDECALSLCTGGWDSLDTISCISSMRDRFYTDEELIKCNRFREGSKSVILCLASSGTSASEKFRILRSEDRGYTEGAQTAEDEVPEFDLSIAKTRGVESANGIGKKYQEDLAYNKGYAEAKVSEKPLNENAFAIGVALGEKLAAQHAGSFAQVNGFNQAYLDRWKDTTPAQNSVDVDLLNDQTTQVDQSSLMFTRSLRMFPKPSENSPPNYDAPLVLTRDPGSQQKPSSSDIPVRAVPAAPTALAPCDDENRQECIDAFEKGFRNGYLRQIESLFTRDYRIEFRTFFNNRLKELEKENLPEGRINEGREAASKHRGVIAGYAEKIPLENQAADARGKEQFLQELARTPLVRIVEASVESKGGPWIQPGDDFWVHITVENLSNVDAPAGFYQLKIDDLKLIPSNSSIVNLFSQRSRFLPQIPADTRVRFKHAFKGFSQGFMTGSTFELSYSLESFRKGSDEVVGFEHVQGSRTQLRVSHPLEIVSMESAAPFGINQQGTVKVTLKNNTAIASQELSGTLLSMPGSVKVEGASPLQIPSLNPGELFEFEVKMTPDISANFEKETMFALYLSDENGKEISQQRYAKLFSFGQRAGLVMSWANGDSRTGEVDILSHTGATGLRVSFRCQEKIGSDEGYYFRFEKSSDESVATFTGTTGSGIASCEPGRERIVSSGLIRVNGDRKTMRTATLYFSLKKNGHEVQQVKLFVKVYPSDARRPSGCSSCGN